MMIYDRNGSVRIPACDTRKFASMHWLSRGLFIMLLRLADDDGIFDLGDQGTQVLAHKLNADWREIEPHLNDLIKAGYLWQILSGNRKKLLVPSARSYSRKRTGKGR